MSSKARETNNEPVQTTLVMRLGLAQPEAKAVCVAGSFNGWRPAVSPMIHLGNGHWAKVLSLPPGRYEYRFVVDGQWVDDPAAKVFVPNPYGSQNAVLMVSSDGAPIRRPDSREASALANPPRRKEFANHRRAPRLEPPSGRFNHQTSSNTTHQPKRKAHR